MNFNRALTGLSALFLSVAAQAAVVTVNFDSINGNATYTEQGFTFSVVPSGGNHTDGGGYMYFHDGGANPGNTDLEMTFGGQAFSLVSFGYMFGYSASIVGSNGQVINLADLYTFNPTATNIGMSNVTSVRFSAGSDFAFDNLVVDNAPAGVPEPGSAALLGLAIAAAAALRSRKKSA